MGFLHHDQQRPEHATFCLFPAPIERLVDNAEYGANQPDQDAAGYAGEIKDCDWTVVTKPAGEQRIKILCRLPSEVGLPRAGMEDKVVPPVQKTRAQQVERAADALSGLIEERPGSSHSVRSVSRSG